MSSVACAYDLDGFCFYVCMMYSFITGYNESFRSACASQNYLVLSSYKHHSAFASSRYRYESSAQITVSYTKLIAPSRRPWTLWSRNRLFAVIISLADSIFSSVLSCSGFLCVFFYGLGYPTGEGNLRLCSFYCPSFVGIGPCFRIELGTPLLNFTDYFVALSVSWDAVWSTPSFLSHPGGFQFVIEDT